MRTFENRRQNHIAELDQHKFSLKCLFEEGKFGTKANFLFFIMASEAKAERGMLWGEQVQALIEIWAGGGIQQQLNSCTRKRPIFEKIARRLEGEGHML